MTTPAVQLCNAALRMIGSETINSFADGTELAEACGLLFDDTVLALQAGYPWRFSLRKQQLSRQAAAPPNEWTYAHRLPADQLVLRQLFNTAQVGAPSVLAYEVFGTLVYSDQPELWADYQVATDPATWPPYFRNLARHALAATLAIPVAESTERADYFDRLAYGSPVEGRVGGLTGLARRLDAQQQPPQAIEEFPLITARQGGWR